MLTGWRLSVSKLFIIPQRWVIGIMGFLCIAVGYMLRVCLNISITQMVLPLKTNSSHFDPDACVITNPTNATKPHGQYDWDEYTQGLILGSFYYGYVVTHVPAGLLAEKYGAKYILGLGILATSLLTIATPAIVKAGGANALIATRVVEGLAEGPTSPALAVLMSRWVPKHERGRLGSLIFGGAQIGNIVGTIVSGFVLSEEGNWPLVFYMFGGIGVAWFIAWCIFVYSEPKLHPFISDKERIYLHEHIEEKTKKSVPWKPFLCSIPLWSIVIAGIGHDWGYFTMVTDLPKYMVDVLKFNIKNTGLLAALPYFVMWLMSFVFGAVCDYSIKKKWLNVKNARKLFTTIASIGPGIFIVVASYVGCDPATSVGMFTLAMAWMGAYYCGMKVNALDITPNYAGTATALINGIAAISGIITPYIVGVLAPNQTRKEWQLVFWIVFGVLFVTDVVYLIFAEGEEQWWNDIDKNGYPPNWKQHKQAKTSGSDEEKTVSQD